MKKHTNIVVKYRFEIYTNCDWPPKSLLHSVLFEICHVTLVSNLACIWRAELLCSSQFNSWASPE